MNDIYININKVAEIKGLKSTRSLRMAINKGKYKARTIPVNGGYSYEILYSSLEPEVQEKLEDENVYFSPNCTKEDINSYFGNTNESAKNPEKNEIDILIDNLTPQRITPKEIYIKNFGDIDGYYKYFVSPKEVREKILFMLKSLKHTQGKSELYIQDYCSRNDIVYSSYKQAVNLLPRFGFSLFLQEYDLADPLELYEYFKEFYLTPYNLSATEALELAHKKFEDYLDVEVEWKYFKGPFYYLRRVLKEYSTQDIRKFRKYNYSEFDLESMKLESVNKPH